MKVDIKNITNYSIKDKSLKIKDSINQRSTASFIVQDEQAQLHFNQGLPVVISEYSDEIPIYNNYNPIYDTKARISYIKGKTESYKSNNIFDEEWLSGVVLVNGVEEAREDRYTSANFIPIKNGVSYHISENGITSLLVNYYFYDSNKNFVSAGYGNTMISTIENGFVRFYYFRIPTNTMLNEGTTPKPYEPIFDPYLLHVNPTIEGISLDKPLRSVGDIYDEYIDGSIIRKCEEVDGVVYELATYTEEYAKPIIFDMTYNQPLAIDSIDTTIKAYINYMLYFSGFIQSSSEKIIDYQSTFRTHNVYCKDNHYLADKRIIAKSYPNMYCGDIVKDIITNYLADEGVYEGTIQQGELMEEVVFNYIHVNKALERLAEASGFIWYIDYTRTLDFMARDTDRNTIDITEADCTSVKVDLGNDEYRNKQYIKGGKSLTDLLTETFKGDGTNRNFSVAFPVGEEPTIKINDFPPIDSVDVGIRGVEEDKKWYWSKDSNNINQNDKDTLGNDVDELESTDSILIEYRGLFDIVVATPEVAEIDKRSELENNSGKVEHIEEELDNNSITISLNSAIAKLNKYAVDGKTIKILTRRKDLESGQIIHATFPSHDINEDVLVHSINVTVEENTIWHDITLLVGPEATSFYKIIKKATSGGTRVIRENIDELQALVLAFEFDKTWLETDTPNIFYELYPSETLYPSTTLYPMFEPNDRVKYMEVLQGAAVVARVYRIKQTETDKLTTLFYIKNTQANGDITSLKFYGGVSATETVGSGILIDTQTFAHTKTLLEILQIFKNDIKGY